jgi:hypothetical protein
MRISKSILRYVQTQNVGVLTNDAQDDERWDDSDPTAEIGIHEAICVPLCGHTGFLGAIYVDTFKNPARIGRTAQNLLTEEHLKIMVAIGTGQQRTISGNWRNHCISVAPYQEHPSGNQWRYLPPRPRLTE